jgi:hypothetical protein
MAFEGNSGWHRTMNRRHLLQLPPIMFLSSQAAHAAWPGNVNIDLYIDPDCSKNMKALLNRWITKSAEAVTTYYGKFPVPDLRLQIDAHDGNGVEGGRTEPEIVPHISVSAGLASSEDELLVQDWVLVHEMIHTAIPYVERDSFWLAEGIAVYVESIARVQAGHIPAEQIWRDFLHQMPRGLPKSGDNGLNFTRDHGRVYWGGALFCLMADLRIRKATENQKGLQHALRAINAVTDFRKMNHDLTELFKIGDAATGTTSLMDEYKEMAMNAGAPDLPKLWKELGVSELDDGAVSFDKNAPQAAAREAIMRKLV